MYFWETIPMMCKYWRMLDMHDTLMSYIQQINEKDTVQTEPISNYQSNNYQSLK